MMKYVMQNPTFVVVAAIIVICVAVMVIRTRKGMLIKAALYAVTKAEENWGSNTGRIKFAEVYTYLCKQYPIITLFFTESQVAEIIEDALKQMKEILATKNSKESKQITEH